jgi:hypothetical protein
MLCIWKRNAPAKSERYVPFDASHAPAIPMKRMPTDT